MENIKPGDLCVVKSGGEKICFIVDEATPNFVSGTRLNLLQFRDDLQDYKYPNADSWAPYVKPRTVSALREQVKPLDVRFVSDSQMRRFARYEISLDELSPSGVPFEIVVSFDFALTLDDLLEALRKIRNERDKAKLRSWAFGFCCFLLPSVKRVVDRGGEIDDYCEAPFSRRKNFDWDSDSLDDLALLIDYREGNAVKMENFGDFPDEDDEEWEEPKEKPSFVSVDDDSPYFPTEKSVLFSVCRDFYSLLIAYGVLNKPEYFKNDAVLKTEKYSVLVGKLVKQLEICVENRDLPFIKRYYDWDVKRRFVESLKDAPSYEICEEDRALFARFVEELCEEGERTATEIKARACYEGNDSFERDVFKARDLFLKLTERSDADPEWFRTLGNIYYEGSCNDGRPEFEKAFYYYSIAAASGDWNARLCLADMFCQGFYAPKKRNVYWKTIWELYQEKFELLFENNGDLDFGETCSKRDRIDYAEIALRVGDAYRDGIEVEKSWERALYYYLQAKFADRGLDDVIIGDSDDMEFEDEENSRSQRIDKAIRDMEKRARIGYFQDRSVKTNSLAPFLNGAAPRDARFQARVKSLEDDRFLLKLAPLVKTGVCASKFLLTSPQRKFCGFVPEIILTVKSSVVELDFKGDYASFIFDKYDEKTGEFYWCGENVARIKGDFFWTYGAVFEDVKRKYVAVTFKNGFKTYDYLCDIDDVKVGDKVLAPTMRGSDVVEVQSVFERWDSASPLPIGAYKKIIGKVDK